jgi:PRTRC genetic system protein E
MFKELVPVLRHRAVLMTITSTADDDIRVNIVPKKLKNDENNALSTPLTVTGTAEQLDAELGTTLVDFVGSHLQLKNTLEQAKADMEAAAKQAQADARAKQKNSSRKDTTSSGSAKPAQQQTKPAVPDTPPPPPAPRTPSLFDMPSSESSPAPRAAQVLAPAATPATLQAASPAPVTPGAVENSDEPEEEHILREVEREIEDENSSDEPEDDELDQAA